MFVDCCTVRFLDRIGFTFKSKFCSCRCITNAVSYFVLICTSTQCDINNRSSSRRGSLRKRAIINIGAFSKETTNPPGTSERNNHGVVDAGITLILILFFFPGLCVRVNRTEGVKWGGIRMGLRIVHEDNKERPQNAQEDEINLIFVKDTYTTILLKFESVVDFKRL